MKVNLGGVCAEHGDGAFTRRIGAKAKKI